MVQNIANAIRQSKKARHTHVSVTDIIFAMSGGIVLLSMDSMLAQSAIIFVVISDKSFVLKKLIGSLLKCSAIRNRVLLASLYDAR
ncbi:hypothetical protein K170097C1_13030 [Hungatella effluvii]